MGKLTLILGGARSGKSTYAEQLARDIGGNSVLYLATAEGGDDEMRERIVRHQNQRPISWRTLELSQGVGKHLQLERPPERVVLLDCLTLLVSNVLLADEATPPALAEAHVAEEVSDLLACTQQMHAHLLVVSNEVGMGLVPPYPLGRTYRDALGRANQRLAQAADRVIFLVAGIPMTIKGR